jgi:hypothetical protein
MKSPRKYTRSTKKTYTDSFKVKLGSATVVYTVFEMRQMDMASYDQMEADGITHLKACTQYHHPVDAKGNPVTHVRGQQLEDKHIPAPYHSAADEHGL